MEPVTISIGIASLASHMWDFLKDRATDAAKDQAQDKWRDFTQKFRDRLLVGAVPADNILVGSLHRSLAGAALVFAYSLHDPDRRLFRELLKSEANWKNFKDLCLRIQEAVKGNIIPENVWRGDAWLAQLIEKAGEPENFNDFNLSILLADNQITGLLREQLDATLRDHLNNEFLRWSDLHVTVKAPKPPDFASSVRGGLTLRGAPSRNLDFYQVFSLFFREELQSQNSLFQTCVTNVLAELKGDVDQLVASLPSPDERARFQQAIDSLGRFDAFKSAVERQNKEQFEKLDALFARLDIKLDYAIAGLPIQRFEPPDPPTRELELLYPKHRLVDLVGRDNDLASLWQWLREGENISARLIIGGAGAGKTRLALELLVRVNQELPQWQAGLITGAVLRRFDATKQPLDWSWSAPTFLVADYAQTLTRPLAELLRALTHKRRATDLPALRLLLLERQAGGWFDNLLLEEDSDGPCAVAKLFDPPKPVELTPLPQGRLRRQIFERTLANAVKISGKSPADAQSPEYPEYDAWLKRDIFNQPLNLMLAALAAGELGLAPALTCSRIELAEVLAKRELARVERFARDPQNESQKRALRRLAACATMERGFTAEELDSAVDQELAAMKITWPDGPGDLADLLRQALPGDPFPVARVEPEFVGEALVLDALARPDTSSGPDRWRAWCATVERCCRRDSRATPATLLHAFQNFGQNPKYGEPLLAATDALIRTSVADAHPALLAGIEGAMPLKTVELRPRAAEVATHLYARLKAELSKGREELKPEVARIANSLATRLSEMGLRQEALAPAQESVDLRRELARRNPDAFEPALANSLNNLSNRLSDVCRWADALAAAREVVELRRKLAGRNPAFLPDLAVSLNNLAIAWREVGNVPESVKCAQESVDLNRALARNNPEAFEESLATSLNTLANGFGVWGRPANALEQSRECVQIYRSLAQRNPDAHQPTLAIALDTFSIWLSENHQAPEALDRCQEAVDLYRALFKRNPDAFKPDLAKCLNNLANRLRQMKRPADAVKAGQESVDLYRDLSNRNPDAFQSSLAMSLYNLALGIADSGRHNEAPAPAQEAVDLYRSLASRNPAAFQSVLADSLINLANRLALADRRADSLTPANEAVQIRRAMAQTNPAREPALAKALGCLAQRLASVGQFEEALPKLAEGLRILTPHFEKQPRVHALLISELYKDYAKTCQSLGQHPDESLLAPIKLIVARPLPPINPPHPN